MMRAHYGERKAPFKMSCVTRKYQSPHVLRYVWCQLDKKSTLLCDNTKLMAPRVYVPYLFASAQVVTLG